MAATRAGNGVHLVFRAFSDPTRVRILRLLERGELCVGDLVGVLRVPQPTASRHLAYLRRAGLVQAREEGLWKFYRLAPARTVLHRKLLECVRACWADVPQARRDAGRLEAVRRSGGCCPGD
jgi:ArsR family transcriptional regulator